MKKLSILLCISLAALLASLSASAQNAETSPYSRYGYGKLDSHATAAQKAMGGVGLAMRDGRSINFMNPASYAAIDTLTFLFDMAGNIKGVTTSEMVNDKKMSGRNTAGGLDYVAFQFPVTRYGGMAVGLVPYSSVGYKFAGDIENGTANYEGSGNINELFLGISARPFKGLTLGANISYMFGTLLNDNYVYSESSSTLFEKVMEIRDYNIRVGVQYSFAVNDDNTVGIGAIYSPKKSFRGHAYGVKYDMNQDSKNDTVGYTSMRDKYQQAETWGAGISWTWRKKLTIEADYTYQPWKNMKYNAIEGYDQMIANRFDNYWKGAIGAQFIPNLRGNYPQRIAYRAGAWMSNDYILVGGNKVKEYGVSVGFGLPAISTKTVLNLTFEYRHREASPVALVKENYFQFTLGINVNELWFWQNKLR